MCTKNAAEKSMSARFGNVSAKHKHRAAHGGGGGGAGKIALAFNHGIGVILQ